MNLLFDKREKSEQPGRQDVGPASSPGPSKGRSPKPPKPEKLKKPRKRMSMTWLYVFIIPLGVLVLAMSYIYYFKRDLLIKPKNKVIINQRAPIDTTGAASSPDSMAMIDTPVDTVSMAQQQAQPRDTSMFAQTPQKPVVQQQQQQQQLPRPQQQQQQQPVSIPAGSMPSVQLMSAILQRTSSGMTITSLYIDENTFSVGVKGTSDSGLNSFYESMRSSLPAGASITTKPTLSRNQSLIAGTYTGAPARNNPTPISAGALSSEIKKIIQKENALNREITVSAPQTWNNRKRVQVFVKISGQLPNCQNVVRDILAGGWDLTVSKIIIMPENSTSGTLVFRFFLNNPA